MRHLTRSGVLRGVLGMAVGLDLIACGGGAADVAGAEPPAGAGDDAGAGQTTEPFPWEPIDALRLELAEALARGDWGTIAARLPYTGGAAIMRYPTGVDVRELAREELIDWLRARWTANVVVAEARFVAHFPSLEMATTGWRPVAPSGATIHLVHHVRPETRRWYLDVVQYE